MNRLIVFALLAVIVLQIVAQARADLWIPRPGGDLYIKERTDNMTTTNETSVGLGVSASKYVENGVTSVASIELNVSMAANSRKAIDYTTDSNLMPMWSRNTGLSWVPPWDLVATTINTTLENQAGDNFVATVQSYSSPFLFRFFGGVGSAEYETFYVSSNGFIGFDNTTQPSPTPSTTLTTEMSNAMIAAVWTRLNITGGNIIAGNINPDYTWGKNYFVVIWNNVLDEASNKRISFEIVLADGSNNGYPFTQSDFWIIYFSVDSISETWGQGYRDQEGYKNYLGLLSGSSLGQWNGTIQHWYQYPYYDYVLSKLTLSYQDTYPNARFWIGPNSGDIRGYNLQTNLNAHVNPDFEGKFFWALFGTAALMIGTVPTGGTDWVWGAGLIMGTIGTAYDWYSVATTAYYQYSNVTVDYYDSHNSKALNWANATATAAPGSVDATFSNIVDWQLDPLGSGSPNHAANHSLTITATLTYDEVDPSSGQVTNCRSCTTSVVLSVGPDGNDNYSTAQIISSGTTYSNLIIGGSYDTEDYFNISLDQGARVQVIAQAYTMYPSDVEPYLWIFLHDPGNHVNATVPFGHSVALAYTVNSTGNWAIEMRGEANDWGWYNLTATVDDPPGVPTLSGPSGGYAGASYTFYANTTDPENNSLNYTFNWGDGSYFTTTSYASGAIASANHTWSFGVYYVKVGANDALGAWSGWSSTQTVIMRNPALTVSTSGQGTTYPTSGTTYYTYGQNATATATAASGWSFTCWILDYYQYKHDNPTTITMTADHILTAYFSQNAPGGGGGCPYVSTWNGSQYVLDNNLLAASMFSQGADVNDSYELQQKLAQNTNGTYSLLLSEFENERDFIDQVQLVAVDHASNVNVGVSPSGQILTYANPSPPVSATTNEGQNVKQLLSAIDGRYYEAHNGSYVILNFGDLDVSQGAKLVLRADYEKDPVFGQVQDSKGQWTTVAEVIPRVNWSTDVIDMSKFLPDARSNLKVRLCFTADLKVDFVGLDTTPQAKVNIHEGHLVSAISSAVGNVTSKLLHTDQTYAELVPGESIQLQFTLPPQTMETRTYIIFVRGHYYTVTP